MYKSIWKKLPCILKSVQNIYFLRKKINMYQKCLMSALQMFIVYRQKVDIELKKVDQ